MLRPDGVRRDLRLIGRGRDLLTDRDGRTRVVDEASMEVLIDYLDAASIIEISTTPSIAGLHQVIGRAAATGFRAAMDAAIGAHTVRGRPIYQLLDDIPVATLVSGYAVATAVTDGPDDDRPWRHAEGMAELQVADLCAGFQAGGTIMRARDEGTRGGGSLVTGPIAPSLLGDDPWSWHDIAPLIPDAMRRWRRIDISRVREAPELIEVDALFRDSHLGDDGYETIIHEYVIHARVDPTTNTFLDIEAVPHVLPWYECPQAAASAQRLVGRSLDMLRPAVRAEFLGPTTCTHLNDTLRALEDIPTLIHALSDLPT